MRWCVCLQVYVYVYVMYVYVYCLFVHQCFYRRINLVQLDDACHYRRYMLWNNQWIHYPHECFFLQGHGPDMGQGKETKFPITGEPPPPKKKKHTTSQRGNSSFHDIFNYLRWSTCEVINTPSHEGSALASLPFGHDKLGWIVVSGSVRNLGFAHQGISSSFLFSTGWCPLLMFLGLLPL